MTKADNKCIFDGCITAPIRPRQLGIAPGGIMGTTAPYDKFPQLGYETIIFDTNIRVIKEIIVKNTNSIFLAPL